MLDALRSGLLKGRFSIKLKITKAQLRPLKGRNHLYVVVSAHEAASMSSVHHPPPKGPFSASFQLSPHPPKKTTA